jgi:hypothetical protein
VPVRDHLRTVLIDGFRLHRLVGGWRRRGDPRGARPGRRNIWRGRTTHARRPSKSAMMDATDARPTPTVAVTVRCAVFTTKVRVHVRLQRDVSWIVQQISCCVPELLSMGVFSKLTPTELAACCATCRAWRSEAGSDWLWRAHVDALCAGKVHRPELSEHPRRAFAEALAWFAKTWITAEELCSFVWCHRMKESAGEHFIERDPCAKPP